MSAAEEANRTIFVWDHTNMDLGNATEAYRALFADDQVPLDMLVEDHDFAEFEMARDAKRVLETKMPESLAASADEADVVLVALWPYGLCMLNVSGHSVGMADWQTQKGILAAGSCPEIQAAYTKIVKSDRFAVADGRDFAFIADKVTKMLEDWSPGWAYKQLVNRSVLVGVEERRLTAELGSSRHLPVPYYVDPEKWYLESNGSATALRKDNFAAYWGSKHVGEHCPACSGSNDPKDVRDGIIDQLVKGCESDSRQCKIIVNDDSSDRNTFLDDADLTFEMDMQNSVFCPVPRGDSAATKRFYCALAALCIPVVVSDHFPFPYANTVDYSSFVIRYSESDVASRSVDVYRELSTVDPLRIRQMQEAMESARHDLLYTRNGSWPAWHKGRAVINVVDELRRLPVCHQSSVPADGTSERCDRNVVGGTFEGCISCKPKLELMPPQ